MGRKTTLESMRKYYEQLFETCKIIKNIAEVEFIVLRIISFKKRYQLPVPVPWFIIGCLHYRECNNNFSLHLHNGDPLTWWTVNVPKGRPPNLKPPFRWEDSAVDAINLKKYLFPDKWDIAGCLYFCEGYNGFGYYKYRNMNSPYLWSYSNHYTKGKYVKDGKFDPNIVDKQVGCACLLKLALEKGLVTL